MEVFEILVLLLLAGTVLAAGARHVGAPYPALVALGGAALAFVPGVPTLALDPELALALFVAPVLTDAAFDASPRDLRANWRQIASLAVGAVAITIALVACLAVLLVPDMPWAAAIALGAIVAPPDASAATTVLKALHPPQRLLVILEGESLFNDASALLVYRLAVGAATTGLVSGWSILPTLLMMTVGSLLLGLLCGRLTVAVIARTPDVATAVVFQFASAIGVWLLAERLHFSGIITAVVSAMMAARLAPERMPARIRIPSWAVWEVAVFVLNVLAFILVGFHLRSIAERAPGPTGNHYFMIALLVFLAVVAARLLWVRGAAAVARWRCRSCAAGGWKPELVALSPPGAAVVGWCGMRGTVTLATALALPIGGGAVPPFPYRDLILVCAFGVTLGTLVIQGLTLRPLLLRLGLEDDGSVERELLLARKETLRAALSATVERLGPESSSFVRLRYERQLRRAEAAWAGELLLLEEGLEADNGIDAEAEAVLAATGARRRLLVTLRSQGQIGEEAFQRLQEELDWAELYWTQLVHTGQQVHRLS